MTEPDGSKPLYCPYACGGNVTISTRDEYGYGGEIFEYPEMQCAGCYATWNSDGSPNFFYTPRPGGDPG